MGTLKQSAYCEHCRRRRLFVADDNSPNHVLHAILSIFLCGLWFPVWLALAVFASRGVYRCVECGESLRVKAIWSDDD